MLWYVTMRWANVPFNDTNNMILLWDYIHYMISMW